MLTPTDFPRLQLCKVCSDFFTGHIDQSSAENVHRSIWYEGNAYAYTRTRKDMEQAASSGCVFCNIVFLDKRYAKNDKDSLCLEKQRPGWFPPLDERLYLQIQYHPSKSSLTTTFESKSPARTILEKGQLNYHWDLYYMRDDPAADIICKEALPMEPGSPRVLKEAREWMNDCLLNHSECPQNKLGGLPVRLVQVSPLGEPEWAKIWECKDVHGQYCALSYCWGVDQEHMTLVSRYEQYKKELPYLDLPRTITDAFQVTRNMGMEHIWIDSLCIVQDDEEDKQREIAKMMSIYQEAQFTISAACASKVTEGFIRSPVESGLFYHPLRINQHQTGSVIIAPETRDQPEPINDRGWTLQESLLAPRLLIFTDSMAVWKCQRGYQPHRFIPKNRHILQRRDSQSSDAWENWYQDLGYIPVSLEELRNCPAPDIPRTADSLRDSNLLDTWYSIIEQYTRRHLSMSCDRLPAISAIARAFASRFQCNYYAGLWDKSLVYDLSWRLDVGHIGPSWKSAGPSWSWATVVGKSCEYPNGTFRIQAEVISCKTTLVSENPYGKVIAGELVIRGYLHQVSIIPGTAFSPLFDKHGHEYQDSCFTADEIASPPPDPADACDSDRIEAWCFVLTDNPGGAWCHGKKIAQSNRCVMMVLVKTSWKDNVYKRIGIAEVEDERLPYWWEASGRVLIKIV